MTDYPLTEDYRKIVYNYLAKVLEHGLEEGEMSVEEAKASSEFILGMDAVDTLTDLLPFLETLGQTYPVYQQEAERITNEVFQILKNLMAIELHRNKERKDLGEEKWRRKVAMVRMVIKEKKSVSEVSNLYHIDRKELEEWVRHAAIEASLEHDCLCGKNPFKR